MSEPPLPRRRVRYAGAHPRRFADKYKEREPQAHPETVAKVLASGKTPAGTHRPIMVAEILETLRPAPGEVAVDGTLGYGGHAAEILPRLRRDGQPGGHLLGFDLDPLELPKTTARLRALGFGPEEFTAHLGNFAGLAQVLVAEGFARGADLLLADLGVSSMQIDDPARGFSFKRDGPLDMRMNPARGEPASLLLHKSTSAELTLWLRDYADEPHAEALAAALAGRAFASTGELRRAVAATLLRRSVEDEEQSARRVFQALRIAVNQEFSALEHLLRQLPHCLAPGGRAAILSFHSGEDRRVKKAFEEGRRAGLFSAISEGVLRPSPLERHQNPRSSSAKLRWARRAPG